MIEYNANNHMFYMIEYNANNHYVRYSSQPLMSRNWEILMEFKVHGQGRTLYGDGFALWYSHERQLMAGNSHTCKFN